MAPRQRLATSVALSLLLAAPGPSPAAGASLVDRWLPTAWRAAGDRSGDRSGGGAGGGLYAHEAEQAGWEEGYEEVEEKDSGADYVTEMLGAQARARRRLQTACDTVEPLGSAVGVGGAAVTFATDGTDATFAAGPPAVGAYVDGAAITAADMTAAVDGTFSCDAGYALDTTVTFVCGAATGAATLSAQPCALEVVETPDEDEAAEEEGEPACPEDPACRPEVRH
jgi:hypothetical protein